MAQLHSTTMRQIICDLNPGLEADQAFLALLNGATHNDIAKGAVVVREADRCENLLWVTQGTIRVYRHSQDGREVTLYRVNPGELCILSLSCLLNDHPFPAEARTESDTQGLVISASEFFRNMDESHSFRSHVLRTMAERITELMALVSDVTFRRLDLRLACLLGQHFERSGGRPLAFTHEKLAKELGTSREVISRILKEFERQDCIRLSRGCIYLISQEGLNWFGTIKNDS